MRGRTVKILALLFLASLTGCLLGPPKPHGIIGYRPDGRVFLSRDRFYHVGILQGGWRRISTKARTITFYNPEFESSISTDAFCGRDVANRRLDSLGGEIMSAMEDRKLKSETSFDLDGRGAQRQLEEGKMDGVPVVVDLVIVRKNGCLFDLYAVMPPNADPQVAQDFEVFFGGFHY